ncbi:hypothetical protein QAD02_024361 [Eretmocerus hayati]|uniref:Uncharacterized protein n=1 Tax=Eretmocerus hayati TaxID=131215 RepID=A0ACC2PYE2_9HYME|nr:hypothetical protein QAD02_024361 [Eretmocerus hayati]
MSKLSREDAKLVASQVGLFDSPGAKMLEYRLEPFARSKNGILGEHELLLVEISNPKLPNSVHSFFVKSTRDKTTSIGQLQDGIFDEEAHFYNKIVPVLLKSYVGEKWSPRCFLARSNLLVFEDLRSQGYSIRENFPLSEIDIKSALFSLATFHASSVLAEHRLGRKLSELFPNAFREREFTRTITNSQRLAYLVSKPSS